MLGVRGQGRRLTLSSEDFVLLSHFTVAMAVPAIASAVHYQDKY